MITIKLTTEHPHVDFANYTPANSSRWNDCKFIIDHDVTECDYWMVIDGLLKPESTVCPPENIFLFTAEPYSVRRYSRLFLEQFSKVITCQRQIKHPGVIYSPPPLPWHMRRTYDEINGTSINKSKTLNIISSNKQFTLGHQKRYTFALRLKDYFGNDLNLYGRGIQEIEDKWDVQAPSKYAVVVENSNYVDYFTEKLTDCFLTETHPFYYGCPELN